MAQSYILHVITQKIQYLTAKYVTAFSLIQSIYTVHMSVLHYYTKAFMVEAVRNQE